MHKHVISAVMCALLATSVAATFNAAHGEVGVHPPSGGPSDGVFAQISDALVGGDRRTFLDLAEFVNGLTPMR